MLKLIFLVFLYATIYAILNKFYKKQNDGSSSNRNFQFKNSLREFFISIIVNFYCIFES